MLVCVAVLAALVVASRVGASYDPAVLLAWTAFTSAAALAIGTLELGRHVAGGERVFLVLGVTLTATGVVQASHLALALPGAAAAVTGRWTEVATQGSFAARLLMPLLAIVGLVATGRDAPAARRSASHRNAYLIFALVATATAAALPRFAGPPAATAAPMVVAHPRELWAAALYLLAILAVTRDADMVGSAAGRGLGVALFVGFLDEIAIQAFARSPVGALAATGAAVQALAIGIVGLGVIANVALSTRLEREATAALRREVERRRHTERALAREAARYARSNEELQQFAYVASHDLQEPLRMVSSYLQLIARRYDDVLDDDGRAFMDFAVDGAVRMKQLINDLLSYSRVGTRARPPVLTDAHAALEEALENLGVAIADAGAQVTAGPLPSVWADPVQLTQLFQNLIGNAVKFRREGVAPRVNVSAHADGDRWRFEVADNGIGVEPKYRDRVFGVFQRLHGDATFDGNGIGLAVCRKIVERLDGRIWIAAGEGAGTTMHFTLPATQPDDDVARDWRDDPALDDHVRTLIERALELV